MASQSTALETVEGTKTPVAAAPTYDGPLSVDPTRMGCARSTHDFLRLNALANRPVSS